MADLCNHETHYSLKKKIKYNLYRIKFEKGETIQWMDSILLKHYKTNNALNDVN